jgi:uroporphyrin-III C-methyltransferase
MGSHGEPQAAIRCGRRMLGLSVEPCGKKGRAQVATGNMSEPHLPDSSPPPRGPRTSSAGGVIGVILALVAVGASAALWWQQQQADEALRAAQLDATRALERAGAAREALEDRLGDLARRLDEARRSAEQLARQVEALPARLGELEERVSAAQGGSVEARTRWLRAEAEHYLALANAELALAGRWETAIAALELADERLRQLASPAFGRVRERVAHELAELRAVELADIEGLTFSLGRLSTRVDELPMRAEAAPEVMRVSVESLDEAEPGLDRLWLGFKRAMRGIVSIERRDEAVVPMLSADQRVLVRRQLALGLELARVAAVRGHGDAFRENVTNVRELLRREFDAGAPVVENALALLGEMLELDVAPPRPDISGSLELLRGVASGGG